MTALDIESILFDLGVAVTRNDGVELWALCPLHQQRTGKPDKHPSWSINSETFVHHCFSCGYAGTLNGLYLDLMGEVPDDLEYELSKSTVLNRLAVDDTNTSSQSRQEDGKDETVSEEVSIPITEWQLRHFADVPQRLLDLRQLSRDSIDAYEVRWHREWKMWVLPLRMPDGELVGYQFRKKGDFYNYPEDVEKSHTLFGFPMLSGLGRVAVVESPLDAVRLHGLGIPAVSSYGAWISDEQATILSRNYVEVVLALDNDKAGQLAGEKARRMLSGMNVFALDYTGLPGKDPGDVTDDEALKEAFRRTVTFNMRGTHADHRDHGRRRIVRLPQG